MGVPPSHAPSPPLLADEDPSAVKPSKKLALLPLIFLIYFEVAGGPYGEEAAVGAAGPLFAILGFLIFPFIWSIPEALVTAELATAFPGNGGFVIWAHKAFGPFCGSMMGSWKLLSGVINLASYPVLCIDYLKLLFPVFSSGYPRYFAILFSTLFLSFLNYTGLSVVGYAAVGLGIASLSPFLVLSVVAIPKIRVSRWINLGQKGVKTDQFGTVCGSRGINLGQKGVKTDQFGTVFGSRGINLGQKGVKTDWRLFFNTLFWNLNFWDNASTLAGEVEQPQKTFPKALFSAGILTCLAYIIPLLAATGAVPLEQQKWTDGYFVDLASTIAGNWLKIWIEFGAVLSGIGLYEAQLSSCAYQIIGMADIGAVPRVLGSRSERFGTPWVGILISTSIALAVSYLDFSDIISSVNFLYSLGMLLEFAAFLRLRAAMPGVERPYRVPLPMAGLVVMCLVPSGFLVYVMVVASWRVVAVSGLMTVVGVVWYFVMKLCRVRMWVAFEDSGGKGYQVLAQENLDSTPGA